MRPATEETQPPETTLATVPEGTESQSTESNAEQIQPTEPAYAVFAPEDAALVEVNSVCGYDADLPALLQKPLSWDLKKEAPTVLIVHTHGTESYTPNGKYTELSA